MDTSGNEETCEQQEADDLEGYNANQKAYNEQQAKLQKQAADNIAHNEHLKQQNVLLQQQALKAQQEADTFKAYNEQQQQEADNLKTHNEHLQQQALKAQQEADTLKTHNEHLQQQALKAQQEADTLKAHNEQQQQEADNLKAHDAPVDMLWDAALGVATATGTGTSLALAAAKGKNDPRIPYGPVENDVDREVHGEDDIEEFLLENTATAIAPTSENTIAPTNELVVQTSIAPTSENTIAPTNELVVQTSTAAPIFNSGREFSLDRTLQGLVRGDDRKDSLINKKKGTIDRGIQRDKRLNLQKRTSDKKRNERITQRRATRSQTGSEAMPTGPMAYDSIVSTAQMQISGKSSPSPVKKVNND